MYKILIVEDDAALAKALLKTVSSWDYEVRCVKAFDRVLQEFQEFEPHLVIMDIMLPFFNGYHWCAEIRKTSKVPVMFLSSSADNMNIVIAINMGGDDFIAKPVDGTVLVAKIQALLRRSYDLAMPVPTLSHEGLTLDLGETTVSYQGKKAELTKNEFRIMQTLLENQGKVVSRDTLMMKLWQMDCYVEENTLTVNVNRLRKKLADLGVSDLIKTKVGSGYLIER
ncbi:MAG: response regulator transcription factor [Oscillospiraceae bacterium]|nr:response regulator transcription factor [Oscillospiraceae bacterium]